MPVILLQKKSALNERETLNKLRDDPLMSILRQEKEARQKIIKNPVRAVVYSFARCVFSAACFPFLFRVVEPEARRKLVKKPVGWFLCLVVSSLVGSPVRPAHRRMLSCRHAFSSAATAAHIAG